MTPINRADLHSPLPRRHGKGGGGLIFGALLCQRVIRWWRASASFRVSLSRDGFWGRIHACRRGELTQIGGVVKHFSKKVRLRKPLSSNQLRHFLHVVSRKLSMIDGQNGGAWISSVLSGSSDGKRGKIVSIKTYFVVNNTFRFKEAIDMPSTCDARRTNRRGFKKCDSPLHRQLSRDNALPRRCRIANLWVLGEIEAGAWPMLNLRSAPRLRRANTDSVDGLG